MKRLLHLNIRTRLLVTSLGIILLGFSGLTVIAGGQIQAMTRLEYEQHLQDEVRLLAQKISGRLATPDIATLNTTKQKELLQGVANQSDGQLRFFLLNNGDGTDQEHTENEKPHQTKPPEVETASRGEVMVVERANANGDETLYTAASLSFQGRTLPVVLQLAVPINALRTTTLQHWLILGLACVLFTAVALWLALWLANSIIRPLYHLRESALKLAGGQMGHRVTLKRNDEIAEVGQAFNTMAQQIENMLEEQRAFASNTSHELRTPLTAIRLRTEALRYEEGLDETTVRQYIQDIDNEVIHLSELVQELLLLAQFDAKKAELGREQIDLTRFASALIQQEQDKAREKQIVLSLQSPDWPVLVVANISHLTVVFRNILENALKYTPERGNVTWTITIEEKKQEMHHLIQDSGQGIPADALPHLFERFYRAEKAQSRDAHPGHGLGLAIVKSLVEAYGGGIVIESAGMGKGTSVSITWPYETPTEIEE